MTPSPPQLEDHTHFDSIEEAFHRALDRTLDPRGPDSLFDIVAALDLPSGASVVDVGCGRGDHALELARRFEFDVIGVDPAPRHDDVDRQLRDQPLERGSVEFFVGTAEALPLADASQDLVFCRESLMYTDLDAAVREFGRVLRPGGRGLIYLVLTGPQMSDAEANDFNQRLGGNWLRPSDVERALEAGRLQVTERIDFGGEWGERAQERDGAPGRRLLHAARLLREPDRYITEFGEQNYNIMLGDCLWHVYRLLGKLAGYACTFTKPKP